MVNDLRKVGSAKGSNPGGVYETTGTRYYLKHYKNKDQALTEVLAANVYECLGIWTLDPEYIEYEGKPSVMTLFRDDLKVTEPKFYFGKLTDGQIESIIRMYLGAILTKNWDIIGLEYDNVMVGEKGFLYSIDQGGAFTFRARGSRKEYGPDIDDFTSLRYNDGASGAVFSKVLAEVDNTTLVRIAQNMFSLGRDLELIREFEKSGLSDWKNLFDTFTVRMDLLQKEIGF